MSAICLEPLAPSHAEKMFEGLRDAAAYQFLPDDPPTDVEALRARYARQCAGRSADGAELWYNWIVRRGSDGHAAGYTQATLTDGSALIAYHVFPRYWRQGVATGAVAATLALVFGMPSAGSARALVDTRNEASIRLLMRLDFRTVRRLDGAGFFKGEASDEWEFELSVSDWRKGRSKVASPGFRPLFALGYPSSD